jgi:hypothetical protein
VNPRHPASGRVRLRSITTLVAAAMFALVVTALEGGALAHSSGPPHIGEFLWGLAGQESGWNYYARNRDSGAFGKYQIMPFNWPAWSQQFLGERWTDQTPLNQERVARAKITNLYGWLGSWRRVAYWWLTGDTKRDSARWSASAKRYVRNVMALMRRAPRGGVRAPKARSGRHWTVSSGDWRLVSQDLTLRPRVGSQRSVGRLPEWTVVRVIRTAWGSGRRVLWMRVETAGGRRGWTTIKVTVPALRPSNARLWFDHNRSQPRPHTRPHRRPPANRGHARPRPR